MAINTQKLLPASGSASKIVKINASKIIPSVSIKKKTVDVGKLSTTSKSEEQGSIVKILTDIDSRLKLLLNEEQRQQNRKRKEKEKVDFEKQEKKLEAPKEAKKFKLPGLNVPGMSFLDRIKRFLFFTALGWLFTKFQDQLPKLEGIVKVIVGVYGVAEGIFKSLLTGLVNFIDIGYQTYDGLREKVEDLGGKDAAKTFDEFSGHLNKLINGAIIAATLIASTDPGIRSSGGRRGGGGGRGGEVGITGRRAGRTRSVNPAAARKYAERYGRDAAIKKFGRDGVKSLGGKYGRSAATNLARKGAVSILGKGGTKAVLKFARPFIKRLPLIGGLIDFGLSVAMGEPLGRAAFKAIGAGVLGAIGTGFGGPLGAIIGGFAGDWAGGKLYDIFFGGKKSSGKTQLKAAGGSVTRGGRRQRPVTRSIRITRNKRPPKVKPKQSQPGKDVGGKKNIQKLYPDPSARTEIEGQQTSPWFDLLPKIPKLGPNATDDEKKEYQRKVDERNKKLKKLPNPYKALTGVAKKLKDIPFGIGALMGGAVDIALGEKLPQNAIDNLGNGIAYLINAVASQKVSASISDIGKEISKMQTGGVVARLRDFSKQDKVGMDITKELNNLIRQKVDQAIKEVQKQMMPGKFGEEKEKEKEKEKEGKLPGDIDTSPGNIRVTSESPDFWLLVTAALFENGKPDDNYQGAADAAQAIYNRVSLPGWPKSIRNVILQPGQFQPVSDYGGVEEWSQINSKEKAIAFAKKYKGYGGNIVERIASTLLDRSKQESARTFVGPRDNFRSDSFEKSNNHLDDSTEKSRYGHTFGFEPRGANIGKFKKGQLMPAEINKEIVKGDVTKTETGPGYGSGGGKIAGELGRFMKKKGVVPGSIHRHPEHPPYSLTSGHSKGSLHYQGRAIDLGANANEQGPILKAVEEFNKLNKVKPVELLHAGNDPTGDHNDHVHVAYQGGGYIPKQSPDRKVSSLNSYPSYAQGGNSILIVEKMVPVPMPVPVKGRRSGSNYFAVAGVNNTASPLSIG